MGFRDTWHRALVYFGLAEDHYDDLEGYDEPSTYGERETGTHDLHEPSRVPTRMRRSRRERGGGASVLGGGGGGASAGVGTADEIDDIFGEEEPIRRTRERAPLREVGSIAGNGGDVNVHLVTPRNFNDAQEVADNFKRSTPVIINLQSTGHELSKRLIDFASGLTYALGGGMQKIADKVFLLTPPNVSVSAEERARLAEKGFFNQS
jgi:cell division inhibitor SepF